MKILVLNSGSSSLKYQLIDMETEEVLAKGNFERIGQVNSFLTHKVNGEKHKFEKAVKNHKKAIEFVIERLTNPDYKVIDDTSEIGAIGHRVVHGGEKFKEPVIITKEVIEEIKNCIELAPLHNPAAISGIEACMTVMPQIPNIAVFDTSFHQTISPYAYMYPIPYRYYEKYRIRKYGFHGISHEYVSKRVSKLIGKPIEELKIINCHLGQGASICAIQGGKSVETSMGFTPVGGIPMGTRSGDLDPSILTYIMKKRDFTPQQIDDILNKKSGALGISEVSVDFRDIEAEALCGNHKALLALDVFAYDIAQYIVKYAVTMQGIDVITFTAGVGEKGPISRKQICDYLSFLGVVLDEEKNNTKGKELKISADNSSIAVYVVPTNEELMIARETLNLIK